MGGEAKSVVRWLRQGWFVAVAYVIGFFVMLVIVGWHPDMPHKKRTDLPPRPSVTRDIASYAKTVGIGMGPVALQPLPNRKSGRNVATLGT